ncbi:MAG: NYN domain-containing protein [Thermoleophilia bacterium]|nr:NYN domain-containing protein [Thermoleophilia bacterium]
MVRGPVPAAPSPDGSTTSSSPGIGPSTDLAAACSQPAVEVLITEEKGSDVNLATYLLLDAFDDALDTAVVVSDDSHLLEPITLVKERLKRRLANKPASW